MKRKKEYMRRERAQAHTHTNTAKREKEEATNDDNNNANKQNVVDVVPFCALCVPVCVLGSSLIPIAGKYKVIGQATTHTHKYLRTHSVGRLIRVFRERINERTRSPALTNDRVKDFYFCTRSQRK